MNTIKTKRHKMKSNVTDYGRRSSTREQKQANGGVTRSQKQAVPSQLLQINAGVMFNKGTDLRVKSRGDMNGM